jgi:hypothetical protein
LQILVRSATDDWQGLHVDVQRDHQLRGPRGAGAYNLPDDDLRVASEQHKIDTKVAELTRLKELIEVRSGRWQNISRLVTACENWVRSVPASSMIVLHRPVEGTLRKGEDLSGGIERLRRRGRELQADLARVRAAPWPASVAKAKMREQIERLAENGRPAPIRRSSMASRFRSRREHFRSEFSMAIRS